MTGSASLHSKFDSRIIFPKETERIIIAEGSPTANIDRTQFSELLRTALTRLGTYKNIAIIPPDHTRLPSEAGFATAVAVDHYGNNVNDVIPELVTHKEMSDENLEDLFGQNFDKSLIRRHDCIDHVSTLGTVDAERMLAITGGIWNMPLPVQLNSTLAEGKHDLILSIGQVMPHEVAGIANQLKNILVGVGGMEFIGASHWVGACAGIERIMGRWDNPVRNVFRVAGEMLAHKNIVYVLTVRGPANENEIPDSHGMVTRGLFIGQGQEIFERAAKLAMEVNFVVVEKPIEKAVVYLDPKEFGSTWVGNKAIYRTRLALADDASLTIIAPGVKEFGERPAIDSLIRKYGYRGSSHIMEAVRDNPDLRENLSAAAHLIHGSSEGRFKVTWCAGGLSREEITSAGYDYGNWQDALRKYDIRKMKFKDNIVDGDQVFYVPNPAQVLLASRQTLDNW